MSETTYTCFKCGYTTNEAATVCPKCGKRMFSSRSIRVRGWLQVVCGLFLLGMMGTITYKLAPSMLGIYTTEDGGRFTGTPEQAKMILSVFGLVIGFGFMSMLSGLWQIVTGRRNKWIFIFMLAFIAILVFYSWYTAQSLSNKS